ncbi:MAG TPA: hypothetical protein VHE34_17235 [Puia sp.]|uniref:hypothetical protein n=1 Tax=Puia sp. TaxID=2045100 RepID=UPI002C6DD61B|nr:hypothetical protein [Puia sp.]HVU96979.1 hypothetical protein [Puia sp.]
MKQLLTILFFLCFDKLQAQAIKISGTWVNTEIYNAVRQDLPSVELDSIVPRCIYIDLNNKMTIEFRFEQKSKTSRVNKISKKGDSAYFSSMERRFAIGHDSTMLLFNSRHNITFKKVSSRAVIGSGIQVLLRNHFWGTSRKWKVINFKNGKSPDTTTAYIDKWKIQSESSKGISRHYEFADIKRYKVNGQMLFGVDLFDVDNKNMSESGEVFGIRKSGSVVYLYKGDKLSYTLVPID